MKAYKLKRRYSLRSELQGLITVCMGPSILMIAFAFLIPMGNCIYLSFHKYHLLVANKPFIGLQNYLHIFIADSTFWHSLWVTFYFTFVAVGIEIILALLIALLLNQSFRGRAILRATLILPWAIPWVVNGIMWKWIYNPSFGILNGLLKQLGLIDSYKVWLGTPFLALNMMVLSDVWKETPFIAILLLAGLQTIPKDLYESAEIDGASLWKRFWNITLPLIRPTFFLAFVLRTIWAFKTFDLVYALTQGGPVDGTSLLNYYIYETSFSRLNFGYGAAVSMILMIIVLGLTLIYYKVIFREVEY